LLEKRLAEPRKAVPQRISAPQVADPTRNAQLAVRSKQKEFGMSLFSKKNSRLFLHHNLYTKQFLFY
jgi:hypothetical protein